MSWFEDKRTKSDVDTLSSRKVLEINEDDLLAWVMLLNGENIPFKTKRVVIEHESNYYNPFDYVPLNQFLKAERNDFYEKYKLLLD